MQVHDLFRWRAGQGWLIFSGGADSGGELRGRVLGLAAADGAVACIGFGIQPAADSVLDDIEDLGAPSGYIVDVDTEDDATIRDRLGEAGIILITSETGDADAVRSSLVGAGIAGIEEAFSRGAALLLEGAAASAFGTWLVHPDQGIGSGLAWLSDVFVLPMIDDAAVQTLLMTQPDAFALRIGVGSALALGPQGEIEIWGQRQVVVTLGPRFRSTE